MKRNSEQHAVRRLSHVSRRSSTSSRRSSRYSRRRSSVRSHRKSMIHDKEKKRELSYDEWIASFMTSQNRSSLTSIASNSASDTTTSATGNVNSRRKTKHTTSTPTPTVKKKCTYVVFDARAKFHFLVLKYSSYHTPMTSPVHPSFARIPLEC